eukprot:m51a1_g8810 putative kinesin-3-like isoform x1 (491) ;mRNA; r:286181-287979
MEYVLGKENCRGQAHAIQADPSIAEPSPIKKRRLDFGVQAFVQRYQCLQLPPRPTPCLRPPLAPVKPSPPWAPQAQGPQQRQAQARPQQHAIPAAEALAQRVVQVPAAYQESLERELADLRASVSELRAAVAARDAAIAERDRAVEGLGRQLAESAAKIAEGEAERRALSEELLDSRGRVRTLCRVRPLFAGEAEGTQRVGFPGRRSVAFGGRVAATFDSVLAPHCSQADLFSHVEPHVASVVDSGRSLCVLAYGQTGSGKTYSVEGDLNDPQGCGLLPRAVDRLFGAVHGARERRPEQRWQYSVWVSAVEVYNGRLRDLLDPAGRPCVRHDPSGRTRLHGAACFEAEGPQDAKDLLARAAGLRACAKTSDNAQSSRSHCAYVVEVRASSEVTRESYEAALTVVDLAGSERVVRSGAIADAERLAEARAINSSLSALLTVLRAVSEKRQHVSFRDSTLTHLLQDTIEGNARLVLLVNVSPALQDRNETMR